MKHGITLDQVYDAMRAGGPAPVTPEGMVDALDAAGLWDETQLVRLDIALSAYGLLGRAGSAESDMQRALEAVAELIKPKRARPEVSLREVLAAVREHAEAADGVIKSSDSQVYAALRAKLNVSFTVNALGDPVFYVNRQAQERFRGQVMRALNKLADEGVLRKVGAGTRGPDGLMAGQREACFYTPEAWRVTELQHQQDIAAEQDTLKRSDRLHAALAALGVSAWQHPEGTLSLDLDAIEQLVSLAQLGAREPGAAVLDQ